MDDMLLSDILKFCETHGLSEWSFGQDALNDRHLIRQLREGRELRRGTVAKIRNHMVTYSPDRQAA
jgi:hypothetical protein